MNKEAVIDVLSNAVLIFSVGAFLFLTCCALSNSNGLFSTVCAIVGVAMVAIAVILLFIIFILKLFKEEK